MRWWLAIGWMLGGCATVASGGSVPAVYMEDLDDGVWVSLDGTMVPNRFRVGPPPTPPSVSSPTMVSAAGWASAGRPAVAAPLNNPPPLPFERLDAQPCPARPAPALPETDFETPGRADVMSGMRSAVPRVRDHWHGDAHGDAIVRFTIDGTTGMPIAAHVELRGLPEEAGRAVAAAVCSVDFVRFTPAGVRGVVPVPAVNS